MARRVYDLDELFEMYPEYTNMPWRWQGTPEYCSCGCGETLEPGAWYVADPDTGGWSLDVCVLGEVEE